MYLRVGPWHKKEARRVGAKELAGDDDPMAGMAVH
jgi:hypothetical protein